MEPSDEMSESYLVKSGKCLEVSRLAYDAGIYENGRVGSVLFYVQLGGVFVLQVRNKMHESFGSGALD